MDKVTVIGGSGFMGSHVADELTNRGYDVTIYDVVPSPWLKKNQKMVEGDIQDLKTLQNCIRDSKYVYHYAGVADIGESADKPIDTIKTNIVGTATCLEACVNENIERFIYASSSSVYGLKDEKDINEEVTLTPLTDYSKFKAHCEKILIKYNSKQFNTIIIRPATVCGYSERQRLDVIVTALGNPTVTV